MSDPRLQAFAERIERVLEEAKAAGYDANDLRKVVAKRRRMARAAATPSVASASVVRVRAWLSANDQRGRWYAFAAAAGLDEKTLRLSRRKSWNPTVNTLQKLEALIPPDWQFGEAAGVSHD